MAFIRQKPTPDVPPVRQAPPEAPKVQGAPESPRAALDTLKGAVSLDNLEIRLRQIEQNPRLSSLEKFGKTVEVYFKAYEGEIDKILDALGLKEEEIEPFLPNDSTPPEENYADAPKEHQNAEKIKPSEERDILGFLRQRNWMKFVERACAKFKVPIFVLLAVIRRESSFNPEAYTYIDPKTGKLASTARGLGQFLDSIWKDFLKAPQSEHPRNLPEAQIGMEGRLIPEYAIWAMARQLRRNVDCVNTFVRKAQARGEKFPPPHFRLNLENASPEDTKWIYMTHTSGPSGYCLFRRYCENPTDENFKKLREFQQKPEYKDATGRVRKRSYIERVTRVTNGGVATAKAFYNQIQKNQPELLAVHQKPLEAIG